MENDTTAENDRLSDETPSTEPPGRVYDSEQLARGIRDAIRAGRVTEGKRDFRLLLGAVSKELLWMAGREVPNRDDAEDIVAKVALDLFRHLERGEPIGNVRALLRTFVTRRAADFWRERSGTGAGAARMADGRLRDRVLTQDAAFWDVQGASDPAPWVGTAQGVAESVAQVDSNHFWEDVRRRLRPEHWEVLVLRHVDAFSTEETAALLGISVDQVKKRLRAALLAAREVLTSFQAPGPR